MAEEPAASTAAAAAVPGDNNEALHKAIKEEDMEAFLDLLHRPGIDLNYKHQRETPLTASIKNGNSRMAKKLIETGCDVNLRNDYGTNPLNLAARRYKEVDITLVQMLLYKGADPNDPYKFYTRKPLHHVLDYDMSNNLELTSMLLYYGADVNIITCSDQTPLQLAVERGRHSCAEVLLNYYDDFSNKTIAGDTVLHYAIYYIPPLVPTLVERGADVNSLNENESCLLHQTEYHTNAKMFKYIWSRINHHLLLMDRYTPFFASYIDDWKFANCEYLECLYLMLESPIAQDLIEQSIDYLESCYGTNLVLRRLLSTFKDRKILPVDRLSAIYSCLSFGIKIETKDLLCAIKNYGFNEEFKALLYAGDFNCCDCIEQIKYFKQWNEKFYLRRFSSFSSSKFQTILEALSKVPKFPSLLELSRNGAQKFIEQKFTLTKLYQFYDVVSCLKLPQSMKDLILLENPIYDDVM